MNNNKTQIQLLLAWLIAVVSLIVTLYASEIANLPVCHLCWYQRICMYPLVIILGIAAFRNDNHITPYISPLCLIGALFSLYQYLEQMIPGFDPIKFCSADIPCSHIHLQLFGFITYPFLGMMAFIAIFIFLVTIKKQPL